MSQIDTVFERGVQMQIQKIKYISYAMLTLSVASTFGADLTDAQIYERCYMKMVRDLPSATDPIYTQVLNGTLQGPAACLQLFDTAQFDTTSGVLVGRNSTQSRNIVKTFNDFHRTFFSNRIPPGLGGAIPLIVDFEEPALYYTRALFQPGIPFSSIVTGSSELRGVRDRTVTGTNTPPGSKIFDSQKFVSYRATDPYYGTHDLYLDYNKGTYTNHVKVTEGRTQYIIDGNAIVQFGALVGITAAPTVAVSHWLLNCYTYDCMDATNPSTQTFLINRHFGSGILGTQAFLQANNNLVGGAAKKYDAINRRISAAFYTDVLCHQLPTLNAGDVINEVDPLSTYGFHKNVSCMQCHSQIDDTALTFRNILGAATTFSNNPADNLGQSIYTYWAPVPIGLNYPNFVYSTPTGVVHYRENITGNLIQQNVSSMADVGVLVAGGDDIYNCAAKRYYKMFTQVDVDLTTTATTATDKYHQDLVIKLGKKLKSTQSVRSIIQDILNSPTFRSSNYLAKGS